MMQLPMGNGPLDHPRLLAIETQLNAGNLDDAQRLLADLGDTASFRHATTYLATRLLYQRGKLSAEDVAQRLRELLATVDHFPEAEAMLEAAETGELEVSGTYQRPSTKLVEGETGPPGQASSTGEPRRPSASKRSTQPTPSTQPSGVGARGGSNLGIPKAPAVPSVETPAAATSHAEAKARVEPDTSARAPSPADSAPPAGSDAPKALDLERVEPEHGPGYYTSRPPAVESVHPETSNDRPRHGSSSAPSRRRPSSVRARPSVSVDETPTLFSVLGLLDDQRYDEALVLLERTGASGSPEFVLMRARALLGLQRRDEAVRTLQRLSEAPLLDAELRAGCARLLIQADELETAYRQAQAAYRIDDTSPVVRLALAWAAVRLGRREDGADKLRIAQDLLESIDIDHGPTPALALGLRACVELDRGEEERALRSARRALDMDANCVDALAALALGSARLGRGSEAEEAWRKLLRLNNEEAHALRALLDRVGVPIDRARPSLAPMSSEPASKRIWDPLETALVNGEPSALLRHWGKLCQEALSDLPENADSQLPWLSTRAGELLTQAPAWTYFGPYDFSLWSLLRLQVALDIVYGAKGSIAIGLDSPCVLMLGAYLGESIRLAHDGYWHGTLTEPGEVRVVTSVGELRPFTQIHAQLAEGEKFALDGYLDLELAHRGALPWARRKQNATPPPYPWGPAERPDLRHVAALGRALGRSMVSLYCERYADGPLDLGVATLPTLDSYLALVSPPHAPVDEASPCVPRAAILVGSYLGEVLRGVIGGEWVPGGLHGSDYLVSVGPVSVAPVRHVMRRLRGEHTLTLTEFVDQTHRELERAAGPTDVRKPDFRP